MFEARRDASLKHVKWEYSSTCNRRKKSGSHSHQLEEKSDGNMGRKPVSNGENSHLPIPDEFKPLVDKIVQFNKQKNKIKKK